MYSFGSLASNQGTFTICITTLIPVNDYCVIAITVTPSVSVYLQSNTVGATQNLPAVTCGSTTGTADDDVWYKFTATATSLNVRVPGFLGFNAVVDVRSGACNGTSIGCADATGNDGKEMVVLTGLTVGNTYLVRIYSFGPLVSDQGSFGVCVTPSPPANDDCANASY